IADQKSILHRTRWDDVRPEEEERNGREGSQGDPWKCPAWFSAGPTHGHPREKEKDCKRQSQDSLSEKQRPLNSWKRKEERIEQQLSKLKQGEAPGAPHSLS